MPEILAAIAPRRRRERLAELDCPILVRAELVSLGGAVLLAVCLVLTAVLIMALASPGVTAVQRFIALILVTGSWLYLLNSITEQLALSGQALCFKAVLTKARLIPLDELEAMLLIHEGFNLEQGIETIEFRRDGQVPDRISLGPCWQRHKLEAFLQSVEKALRSPKLIREAR